MKHELKTWPEYYQAVVDGTKPFEVRLDDRNYQVGDTLWLREFIPQHRWIEQHEGEGYTGNEMVVEVTYILSDPQFVKEGYVIMGIGADQHDQTKDV